MACADEVSAKGKDKTDEEDVYREGAEVLRCPQCYLCFACEDVDEGFWRGFQCEEDDEPDRSREQDGLLQDICGADIFFCSHALSHHGACRNAKAQGQEHGKGVELCHDTCARSSEEAFQLADQSQDEDEGKAHDAELHSAWEANADHGDELVLVGLEERKATCQLVVSFLCVVVGEEGGYALRGDSGVGSAGSPEFEDADQQKVAKNVQCAGSCDKDEGRN